MRQSSVIKEIIRKEKAEEKTQVIIKNIELRIGTLDENLKTRILAIQNGELLEHLHRQSVLAEKNEIEKEIMALSA